ncbi:MAG: hypothetical protein M0Z36_09980 [Thermaerobacter sp.]|nr:hypothetical protein [Thermaerobacter sp.]
MNQIISENSGFAIEDDEAYKASFSQMETPPEFRGWREWDALDDAALAAARARARARAGARTRHYRTHTRARARRSPASTRRATVDSGGDDGGDPDPPRPGSDPSPICGGIAPRMGGAL